MKRQIMAALRDQVINELSDLGAYVYYSARTGSQYIKFEDARLRSVRISDHPGREKYRYKWNLLTNIGEAYTEWDRGVTRSYYPACEVDQLIHDIRAYHKALTIG